MTSASTYQLFIVLWVLIIKTTVSQLFMFIVMQCCTTIFKGSLGKLSELFNDMVVTRQKAPSSQSSKTSSSSSSSSSLPLAARLAFRLHLLHSEQHAKISKIEKGELRVNVSNVNHNMMNVEGLRVLSLSDWPHNYE